GRTARTAAARAEVVRAAAIFVPALGGSARLLAEAQTSGAAIAAPRGRGAQPELAAAEAARLIEDEAYRAQKRDESLAAAAAQTTDALADHIEAVYERLATRRRSRGSAGSAHREEDWILADLHMHTTWSHD